MLEKIKKFLAVITIIVLLPYIITIFLTGNDTDVSGETNKWQELLDEYCIQQLAKEVSSDYEEEMLKVQAVLVRTTVYQEIEKKGESFLEQENFIVENQLNSSWYRKLQKAWDETEGKVVMYQEKLALVPFHQVSNGKTRSAAEVLESEDYPYLQILECPKDVEADNQMMSVFIPETGVEIVSKDKAGYVLEVQVDDEKMSGETFRDTYGLASSSFELQNFDGQTRVITKGVGHGLGLSQYTANEMAKEGKKYEEILQFFFPDTEIKEVAEILMNVE